jgi:integral membrane sensor domain MASE1
LTVRPERLRLALAVIVLVVALRMALGLTYRPDAIYTITPL